MREIRFDDLTGKKFGRLTVIKISDKSLNKKTYWDCSCDCGSMASIDGTSLKQGKTTSCGCYRREIYTGRNNKRWKGTTPLSWHLRNYIKDWKRDSMRVSNFKCVITGNDFKEIHHIYPFYKIVDETIAICGLAVYQQIEDYTDEELNYIKETFLEVHEKYGLGACLSDEMHKEFHKTYGNNKFTHENFYEFYLNKTGEEFPYQLREVI